VKTNVCVIRASQVICKNKKMVSGRALHFVFKVADRALTAKFYREILGMKVTAFTNNRN
jgi:catechol-2,3-dioxygenase